MAEEIKLIEPAEWQLKVPEQSENDAWEGEVRATWSLQ